MRSYGQYCPVAIAAEVLGDRWTLLVVREMLAGAGRFNEIERGLPGISRTTLTDRLRRLQARGLIERAGPDGSQYELTTAGRALDPAIQDLGDWAASWLVGEPTDEQLQPALLIWWIQRRVRIDVVSRQAVIRFDFTGRRPATFWLVIKAEGASVCLEEPGLETDLVVTADPASMHAVYAGRVPLGRALASGAIRLDGSTTAVRAFPHWFGLSRFASAAQAALASAS